jgi:hypothetical protein
MSSDPHALIFVVEDSFHIRGRGVVLAPVFEIDRFSNGTDLNVSISHDTRGLRGTGSSAVAAPVSPLRLGSRLSSASDTNGPAARARRACRDRARTHLARR